MGGRHEIVKSEIQVLYAHRNQPGLYETGCHQHSSPMSCSSSSPQYIFRNRRAWQRERVIKEEKVSRELKRNAVRGEKCVWLKDGGQEER